MPTVLDATVVNQPYDTSGNGGRKLARLSNGWLVAGVKNGAINVIFYKSADNGQTWTQLCYASANWSGGFAMASNGTIVYVLGAYSSGAYCDFIKFDATTVTNTAQTGTSVDSGQTALGAVSLAINSAGTELHAAWASKNSTYPNSFNIRYAKGTINGDGSVTWGAVEQRTTVNMSGWDYKNPTIVVRNDGYPIIFAEAALNGIYYIKRVIFNGSSWNENDVYNRGSYVQSSPSACVDKNGRIWVAWMGIDSTDNARYNIRVAYSDDGGQTWSVPTKLTSGNTYDYSFPSITVNKNNEVFVLFYGRDATDGYYDIRMIKYSSGSWGSISIVSNGTTSHKDMPSVLYDVTIDFSMPLFIYRDQGEKVGFCGTWVDTTISVTPGYIGQKSDKNDILTYSITTDGEMSDIIEKINDVTIATRTNPINEQEFTVSLSQEQWDAIKYGNGHTLTIEMNGDTWAYTFDKRLNANDDILSAVKGVQDLETHLNGIKAQLAEAIRAKGGTVNDTDAWSAFVNAVANMQSKKWATGTGTTNSSSRLIVTGLDFEPKLVLAEVSNGSRFTLLFKGFPFYGSWDSFTLNSSNLPYNPNNTASFGQFDVEFYNISDYQNKSCNWIAFE